MRGFKEFLKATLVGGLLFLVPAILLLIVLRHALGRAGTVAVPIVEKLPGSAIAGVGVATIEAALLLLLVKRMGVGSAETLHKAALRPVPEG